MNYNSIKRHFKWLLLRHPMLYYIRFAIVCRNKTDSTKLSTFNDMNRKEDVHPLFYEVNEEINLTPEMDSFEKALAIATHLRLRIKGGRGLSYSSNKSLQIMLDGQGGVCSDFSQIFNVFCLINGIKVREWGAVDRFYNTRYGHTFNEVYSDELHKWIMVDVGKSIYFQDENGEPFSATKMFKARRSGKPVAYKFFSDYRCGDLDRIWKIYDKKTLPFLIGNYNNKVYDHYLNKFQRLPPFMINVMMIAARKNYRFIFVMDNYKAKLFPIFDKS